MLYTKRWFSVISQIITLAIFFWAVASFAQNIPENDSTKMSADIPKPTPVYKVANLAYVTFQAPQGGAFVNNCPPNMTLVSGSSASVPCVPGYNPNCSSDNPYTTMYWQCMENLNAWATQPPIPADNSHIPAQPYTNVTYANNTYAGTVPGQSSPAYGSGGIYSSSALNAWMPDSYDDSSGNTLFTYYQFPGNSYVPTGIGGSGIGCNTGGGDTVTISCTDSFGRTVALSPSSASSGMSPPASNVNPVIFFIPPNTNATCTVTRTYPSAGASATCSGTVTVPSGQAKVMACCYGAWACSTSNWSDSTDVNTCQSCPATVSCQ